MDRFLRSRDPIYQHTGTCCFLVKMFPNTTDYHHILNVNTKVTGAVVLDDHIENVFWNSFDLNVFLT